MSTWRGFLVGSPNKRARVFILGEGVWVCEVLKGAARAKIVWEGKRISCTEPNACSAVRKEASSCVATPSAI